MFEKLFEVAEIAKFTPDQVRSYEDSLKYYRVSPDRDLKNSLDTAFEEGREEGKEKRDTEIILLMHSKGKSSSEIAELTGLPVDKIEGIIKRGKAQ